MRNYLMLGVILGLTAKAIVFAAAMMHKSRNRKGIPKRTWKVLIMIGLLQVLAPWAEASETNDMLAVRKGTVEAKIAGWTAFSAGLLSVGYQFMVHARTADGVAQHIRDVDVYQAQTWQDFYTIERKARRWERRSAQQRAFGETCMLVGAAGVVLVWLNVDRWLDVRVSANETMAMVRVSW